MEKYNIFFSDEARKDLVTLANYIKYSLNESKIAKKKVMKIKQAIYKLQDNPKIYPIIQEDILERYNLRKFMIDKHIVFYTIIDKTIYIVRILYGRRNWLKLI